MLEINKVYLEPNKIDLLRQIEPKSVDMILADLPYGITNCKWDSIIPMDSLWNEYKRIIKDNGAVVLTACQPFTSMIVLSNKEWFKYTWVWEKTQATGFFNAKKQPMRAHEDICVFYKNQPIYNPQKTTGHNPVNKYVKKSIVANKTEVYGKGTADVFGGGATDRYPRSVIKFSSDKQKTKLTGFTHPTQKPVALFEYLIKTYTNKGDLVLDNVAGSGTTAIACINLNRNYICMDNTPDYVELMQKRIEEHLKNGSHRI